ncbi:MAG: hydrogen gas-evolving membrane-bound hydrogenase subunit E [Thermoplasmata archaeon]
MKEKMLKRIFTVILVVSICAFILQSTSLDHEDKSDSPMSDYYLENHEETGAINLVEAILLDFRAYDTFGEVLVLYISISGVIILGKKVIGKQDSNEGDSQ